LINNSRTRPDIGIHTYSQKTKIQSDKQDSTLPKGICICEIENMGEFKLEV